jgi:hypothetical protein
VKKPLVDRELAFYEYIWGEFVDAFEALDGSAEGWAARRELVAPHSPRKLERLLSFETRQRTLASLRDKLQYRRMREMRCCAGCWQMLATTVAETMAQQNATNSCQMRFSSEAIECLREFTARYYGIVSLSRVRGEWRFSHDQPANHSEEAGVNAHAERPSSLLPNADVRRSMAIADDPKAHRFHELWYAENGKVLDVNPWARVCFERSFAPHARRSATQKDLTGEERTGEERLGAKDVSTSDRDDTVLHDFLVLEDLTYPFRFPSVLDVKVGTRDYDDEASEEKRRRHIEKCRMTTSAAFGVRLTGMQVFQPERHTYLCHDKYHGRRLKDEEQLLTELVQYLDNGQRNGAAARRAIQVANSFRGRLERLREFVATQTEWRFYSSSLLFIYEGDSAIDLDVHPAAAVCPIAATTAATDLVESVANGSSSSNSTMVCMKMIDFAHTQRSNCQDSPNDDGYLLGIETMIRLFSNVAQRFAECETKWQTQIDSEGRGMS